MPLNKPALEAQIKTILAPSDDTNYSHEQVAADLATAIDTYVKSMTIIGVGNQGAPLTLTVT